MSTKEKTSQSKQVSSFTRSWGENVIKLTSIMVSEADVRMSSDLSGK